MHTHFYRLASQLHQRCYSIRVENINLHISDTVEIHLTHDEALLINSLRGLHGKKAKLQAFKTMIKLGTYSYDELIAIFPMYQN